MFTGLRKSCLQSFSEPRLQRGRHRLCRAKLGSPHLRTDLGLLPKEPFALARLLFSSIWTRNGWRWDYASIFPRLNSSESLLICTNVLGKMSHENFFQCQYLLFQSRSLEYFFSCLIAVLVSMVNYPQNAMFITLLKRMEGTWSRN